MTCFMHTGVPPSQRYVACKVWSWSCVPARVLLYKYRVNCVTEGSTYCVLQPYDATKREQEELRKMVLVYEGLAG